MSTLMQHAPHPANRGSPRPIISSFCAPAVSTEASAVHANLSSLNVLSVSYF
ncbi:hypothetical protein MY10362_003931 [Beauveria mimosiformis]